MTLEEVQKQLLDEQNKNKTLQLEKDNLDKEIIKLKDDNKNHENSISELQKYNQDLFLRLTQQQPPKAKEKEKEIEKEDNKRLSSIDSYIKSLTEDKEVK